MSSSSSSRAPLLLLNPVYARSKSVIHDELRNFRVFLQWCALDHSSRAARAASYAAFLALALAVPAAVSLSTRADAGMSPVSASAITFNRVAQIPASGLAVISFVALAAFFRRCGGLRQLLFLDGGLRDDTAFVRRGYARELDRAFRLLAALLLPSLCVEAAHKAVFFFATVRVEPPSPLLPGAAGVPWRAVALVATVASWVYRTGVFLLVCVLFRLTCELQILRFEGIYHMFDVEARASAAEIFAEHRRIRTQLLATSHRYRAFIISCLVTITVSQLSALLVALSSKDGKSFANSGDLLVGSSVQLSGFFMCLLGAARITHRAQRIVSIASQWHMTMESVHHAKPAATSSSSASDMDALHPSAGAAPASHQPELGTTAAACAYRSRHALVTYLSHNSGGITLFGFTLDRGLLHTIFAFEMTLVLWILSKFVEFS
ncbi:uncharacterized protein LOC102701474 [Oryza brachyantha]|uniref:uncharacterized protein LOC102701474 n=1 Tax=Oryza brachyantha TaxID=4533 RepID=UPI001ADBBB3F|nr:uncharacterized protein LOC102701474 [Oryza brachyantha]